MFLVIFRHFPSPPTLLTFDTKVKTVFKRFGQRSTWSTPTPSVTNFINFEDILQCFCLQKWADTCVHVFLFLFFLTQKNNSTVNTVFLSFFFFNLMHSGTLSTSRHRDLNFLFFFWQLHNVHYVNRPQVSQQLSVLWVFLQILLQFPEFLCHTVCCVSSGLVPGSGMTEFRENDWSFVNCDQNAFPGRFVWKPSHRRRMKVADLGAGMGQHWARFCDALMDIPLPAGE